MDFTQLLRQELMIVPLRVNSREEALEKLADRLWQQGYVKNSYLAAVKKREISFPTGLSTGNINVAIPHTDVEHVLQAAMAVGVLDRPVLFSSMENPQQTIAVSLIFMLALKEAHEQPVFLQKVAGILENERLLQSLVLQTDTDDAYRLLFAVFS
ncbi:PTS sugar transporter subunit IIA [Propionispora vibrioides]|uniref:PTS system IIA component, Gat family n=1 Tax=Propionispora vibrioides TaxID=112903 RepID=A0A1H8VLS3_9FIRM|nr:PTS sugar transporter subunit IIA [Propionispora vibrioides]SEP16392.1 PTS system IIA component, Gat family [Propionispora vibrioides]